MKFKRGEGGRLELRKALDGSHWVFLCFTPERGEMLQVMIAEAIVAAGRTVELGHTYFPAGVLWNGRECNAVFVRKTELGREALERGLRKHFGYERPAAGNDIFTLGVTAEEDAALDRVGLFGRK
jgi:hypothetical protein